MEATVLGSSSQFLSWAAGLVLMWALGLVFGWMLPRPKWLQRGLRSKALFLASPPGLWVRRVTLAFHASLIIRQLWRYSHTPGTFRALLRAIWVSLITWQPVEWPKHHDGKVPVDPSADGQGEELAAAGEDLPNWYVNQQDLQFFRHKVEVENEQDANAWAHMMDLAYEGTTYSAWRRGIAGGKTEYKSITITPNATAEEFMDFYLDDPTRPKWDGMISEYRIVEAGPAPQRALVVHWRRTFPFSFISQRDYVIARRTFHVGDTLYGITKGIEHPGAPADGRTVRIGTFYSMWRCRTVPCPHGTGRPACETVLLHHEDFRIPERLAKFAVRHGMPSFFKGMVPLVKEFVAKRRIRLAPTEQDSQAYGTVELPAPLAPRRAPSDADCAASEASFATDSAFEPATGGAGGLHRSPSMRRIGALVLASGVALAIARTSSSSSLAGGAASSGAGASSSRHRHGGKKHHHHAQHGAGALRHKRRSEVATLAAVDE